jgi:hypothetical protein
MEKVKVKIMRPSEDFIMGGTQYYTYHLLPEMSFNLEKIDEPFVHKVHRAKVRKISHYVEGKRHDSHFVFLDPLVENAMDSQDRTIEKLRGNLDNTRDAFHDLRDSVDLAPFFTRLRYLFTRRLKDYEPREHKKAE